MRHLVFPMSTLQKCSIALLCALPLSACVPKKMPGTDIDDTPQTRAVLALFQQYRQAVENLDVNALISLCDESFRDNGGSADAQDDLVYSMLQEKLTERFRSIKDVHLDISVRTIEINEEATQAQVTYSYILNFRMPQYAKHSYTESNIKQMALKRVDENTWKITSGI